MRRTIAVFASLICLTSSASAEPTSIAVPLENPAHAKPADKWTSIEEAAGELEVSNESKELLDSLRNKRNCSDTISKARAEAGLPLLQREPASPDKPYLIYAVDRRESGCSVMVMKGNPDDIRQLPRPMEGPLVVIPAGSGR